MPASAGAPATKVDAPRIPAIDPRTWPAAVMEEAMAKLAFLGLGVMGYPMAGHLKKKGGHDVTVYNRTAAKAEKWIAEHGGKRAATPREAAEGQDLVFSCVGNDADLRVVALICGHDDHRRPVNRPRNGRSVTLIVEERRR